MDNISVVQPVINEPVNQSNSQPKSPQLSKIKFSLKKIPIWLQVVVIVVIVIILTVATLVLIFANKKDHLSLQNNQPTIALELTPTATEEPTPTTDIIPTISTYATPTSILIIITPTLTRIANPPIYKVDYPTEMQSIQIGQGQSFCIIDTPNGGDQTSVQRRHLINDLVWTNYATPFTLCFEPKEGLNHISLQYRNRSGDESPIIIRQFNFHRVANIATTITGQVFADTNCNGTRDNDESEIKANVNLRFLIMPNNVLDGSITTGIAGAFSYSKNVAETDSIDIRILPDNNSLYQTNPKITYPTVTLNKNSTSIQINIPMVPVENLSACN